jgi:SAM-dependent methyltransferase
MKSQSESVAEVQRFYREETAGVVRPQALGESAARAQLRDSVDFVRAVSPPPGALLDLGCGAGWSSVLFAESGYETTGMDLNAAAFEPRPRERLTFIEGDAMAIPFAEGSFDLVFAGAALEHVPDPPRVLAEMDRVLAPGGLAFVVGPNLLSVGLSLASIRRAVANRPVRRVFARGPTDTRRDVFGNTLPEAAAAFVGTVGNLVTKLASSEPEFTMRTPDTLPPFHGDNDACYLCNPLDLERYFKAKGYAIEQNGKIGRPGWLRLFAGGTWFAARKPRR